MESSKDRLKGVKLTLIIMPIIIVALLIGQIIYVNNFNNKVHTVNGSDDSTDVSMVIDTRSGSTSTWLKRDFDLYGERVTLTAQTIDGDFTNNCGYQVKDWSIRINIKGDCLLNQAWCGTMEIHQDVKDDEKVQTLDLRKCTTDDVELDYLFDGDLLIPLHEGDYLIYYPSKADGEYPIDNGKTLTIGFIMYYLETPDLSDSVLTYTLHRNIYDGYNIYIIATLLLLWAVLLILYIVSDVTYKRTVKEMELKKSGIRCLSDIYSIIYIIDLKDDTLTPIFADDTAERIRPRGLPASEQMRKLFLYDASDEYKDLALDFSDLSTLPERLKERNTVVLEYPSVYYGWCRIRFFSMDRDEEGILEKVIFTIQNINVEKKEIDEIAKRADEAEYENKAKSVFLANMSHEIRTPINTVIGLNSMILRESTDPVIKSYARNIGSASHMLLSIINGILDMSKLQADKMQLVNEEYSFRQVIIDVVNMIKTRSEFNHLEFICKISPDIADKLMGDQVRLKQVITNLLTNAAKYTDEGSVTFSVFGNKKDDHEHLLVSVKDTGIGIREEDLDKLTQRFTRFDEKRNHTVEGTGIGLNLVTGILELMDSELHVISEYGHGSEFYFEIDQAIVDDTPVGEIDFNAETEADEDYHAIFTAPDAQILVVDDNAMNLNVFCELLKETELQIDTAGSGAEALKKDEGKKYDIIFMDHMMPKMDGIETLQHIKASTAGKNKETPVIILTANAMKGAKEEYQKAGFDDFLTKPIRTELLEKMILKYLDPAKVKKNDIKATKQKEPEVELPDITNVDVAYGINHTGGITGYMSLLKQFVSVAATDIEELTSFAGDIENSAENRDAIKEYRIKVHSMKSSANTIGALQVYGVAAMLEKAAKYEDIKQILDVTPYFKEMWNDLLHAVREAVPEEPEDTAEKQKPTDVELAETLARLEESIRNYDINNADAAMSTIKSFGFDEDKAKLVKEMEIAVANLDADKVVDLCERIKK